MARIYGLNGVLRGRQGNNIFSVQNGTQVVKAYQPAVSNPRTLLQREQRSKFALAGKLSAVVPTGALVGMSGGAPRFRRAKFVSIIAREAVTAASGGDLVSSIDFEKITFSEGSLGVYSAVPQITTAWIGTEPRASIRVTVPAMTLSAGAPNGYGEMIIVGLFDPVSSRLDEVQYAVRDTTAQQTFTFRVGTRRNCTIVAYAVPFIPSERILSERAGNLYDSEAGVNVMAILSRGASQFSFGNSVLLATSVVPGVTTLINPTPSDDDTRHVTDPVTGDVMKSSKKK